MEKMSLLYIFWNLANNENAKLNFRTLESLSRTQVRLVKHSFFPKNRDWPN